MFRTFRRFAVIAVSLWFAVASALASNPHTSPEYAASQARLARGWNTWDTHSVLSHVLLPEGLAITMGIDRGEIFGNSYLSRALVGQPDVNVQLGPHLLDGSYTDLTLEYRGLKLRVQSATEQRDLVLLVTPLADTRTPSLAKVVFLTGMLWNRRGTVAAVPESIRASFPNGRVITVTTTTKPELNEEVVNPGPYLAVSLATPVGLSAGKRRTLTEVQAMIARGEARFRAKSASFGASAQLADAIETVLGWDTIYEPERGRVLSPVSRSWNENFGGYVLFDWDNFFAAYMAALLDRDLAYANAVEMVNSLTPAGFVPNFARANGWDSYDRSEPPVGSVVVLAIYQKYRDKWFLRDTFDGLLRWNRWWANTRDVDGYLAWGSTPNDAPWERADTSVNTLQGAKYESGLDNSPMYDDVPYDTSRHVMLLADAGLLGLYVADCNSLAKIGDELGRKDDATEVRARAAKYSKSLNQLWDEKAGIYKNKNLVTGKLDDRLSPTNFYPLLANVPTPQQADRMITEHLMNPQEFWGEWVIPAIARNQASYLDQEYWRGRIWGPMNFLVYLGLRNYDFAEPRKQLVEKSRALFLKEWTTKRHVHENYNSMLGIGDDVKSSDPFYHWGALLMFMGAIEDGTFEESTPKK